VTSKLIFNGKIEHTVAELFAVKDSHLRKGGVIKIAKAFSFIRRSTLLDYRAVSINLGSLGVCASIFPRASQQ
jgi:hypothetical protein